MLSVTLWLPVVVYLYCRCGTSCHILSPSGSGICLCLTSLFGVKPLSVPLCAPSLPLLVSSLSPRGFTCVQFPLWVFKPHSQCLLLHGLLIVVFSLCYSSLITSGSSSLSAGSWMTLESPLDSFVTPLTCVWVYVWILFLVHDTRDTTSSWLRWLEFSAKHGPLINRLWLVFKLRLMTRKFRYFVKNTIPNTIPERVNLKAQRGRVGQMKAF